MLITFVEYHMQNHFRLTLAGYIAGFGEQRYEGTYSLC
jgi:hypothetical protein